MSTPDTPKTTRPVRTPLETAVTSVSLGLVAIALAILAHGLLVIIASQR